MRLNTTATHTGFYVADFFTVAPKGHGLRSARFTHSAIDLRDQLGDDLTGDHRFNRLNPSAGVTYQFHPKAAGYFSIGTASRVPTPSELGCADPEDPCRLPNAFVADPPLAQVVARTIEGGVRGRAAGVNWSGSLFRTVNQDDILFISSGALTNEGHFENVGDTERDGLELTASGTPAPYLRWDASYTFLARHVRHAARAEQPEPSRCDRRRDPGPGRQHPSRGAASFAPRRCVGDEGPGDHRRRPRLQFLVRFCAVTRPISFRQSRPRSVVDLNGTYTVGKRIRLAARVTNLFGAEYSTFGLLGEADDVLGDAYDDPRFLGPGAPRAAWVGIELVFR